MRGSIRCSYLGEDAIFLAATTSLKLRPPHPDPLPRSGGEGVKESGEGKMLRGKTQPALSGNSLANPSRDAAATPRSVISPVTSRAGVTSKA